MKGRGAAELVGRDAELARLTGTIEAVAAGGSRVVVLSGEPGIGKTALLEAAMQEAVHAGLRLAAGRAAEQEEDVPFGLVVDALDDEVDRLPADRVARLDAALGHVLPALSGRGTTTRAAAPAPRIALHRALRDLVDQLATGAPLALFLDDLHWADGASLEWVLHLMRRPPRSPHLLVLALRSVGPLAPLLDALRNAVPGEHLEVGPLSREAADALLSGVTSPSRRTRFVEEARGNPLFLSGLARLPESESEDRLPATVMAAVEREVAGLRPEARELLEGAAAVGDPFDADLALGAAGLEPSAISRLDELVAADLVRPTKGRSFAFRHPLVRRAVHDATPAGARLAAHARAAEILTSLGASVERVAHHVERSASVGDEAAARTLAEAARTVAARAPATAAGWFQAALDLTPGAPAGDRATHLSELARALQAAGRHARAYDVLLEALELVDPSDLGLRVDVIVALAAVEHVLGRYDTASARLRSAEAALPPDVSEIVRARLTFQMAVGASYVQDTDELRRLAGSSASTLRPVDPAAAVCDDAMAVIAAMWSGNPQELAWRSAAVHGQVEALTGAIDPQRPYMSYVVGMADLLTQDLAAARTMVDQGFAALRTAGDETGLIVLAGLGGMAAVIAADARGAREATAMAEEAARLHGVSAGLAQALWLRAAIAMLDGDLEDAARAAAEWPSVAEALGDIQLARVGHCYFALLRAADDPAGALADLRRHAGIDLDRIEQEWSTRRLAPHYVRLLLVVGDHEEAERITEVTERRAARIGLPVSIGMAQLARAEIALADGDAAAALLAATVASEAAAARGFEEERFSADLVVARALGQSGRRDEAVGVLRAAADRASAGGAWGLRDQASRELRRLGSRLPNVLRARGEEGELTDRERQISELVVAGRTNKEVGRMLFLSPKTVEHALSRIYAKLSIRGRGELAAALASRADD